MQAASPLSSWSPPADAVIKAKGPLVAIHEDGAGKPIGATATSLVRAMPERLYAAVDDFQSFAKHLPMARKATQNGDRVGLEMGFKIAFFSVGSGFTAQVTKEEPKSIVLNHLTGEPRGLEMRFDFAPGPQPGESFLSTGITFDILSIGWLVKTFLKNHPEIQFGIYPGVALSLLLSVKQAAKLV